ncbi:MAG TPA: shikimate dehydrogenase [Burkholderiaceae bacterium]|nr:shikimate dehydrogenase [Burkholderiaceae bacterium]
MTPAATVDRYAVIGHPVAHSRSPFIHRAFALATGQAMEYTRLECPIGGFEAVLCDFAAGGARGCNVTLPFKFDAVRLAARSTARAELAGAANTLRFDESGWLADNTDGIGLVRDIEANARVAIAGRRMLLIGAGGAAAGALGALLAAAPAELTVTNRTLEKASELVTRHRAAADANDVVLHATPLEHCGEGFDIVVNATASSLHGAASPVDARTLAPGALAIDMMYGPAAQPFLAWAEQHGATGRDGLGMLVEQAAQSFLLWRGVMPETAPVLDALRRRWDETA